MFKKILLSFAIVASTISFAEAKCPKLPYLGDNQFDITVGEPAETKLVLLDVGQEPYELYKVVIQDQKTCKYVKKTMSFEQLSTKYGFSGDEFEDGCVDNPECG